jgi:uncharacterized protein (DUF58 family)
MSITGLAGMYNIKQMEPYLLPPDEIFAGSPAPFRLCVRNKKLSLPSFLISLECVSGASVVFPIVQQHSSIEAIVMLTFNDRGLVPAGPIKMSSKFPVGFFSRYWSFETGSQFMVFPRRIAGDFSDFYDKSSRIGITSRRERGLDGELEKISLYSGAEPLRAIHWKLSARSHELLVKGFGSQSACPLLINLEELPGQGEEERISRAAWLVRSQMSMRPVGLVLGGRTIPAKCGRQHGLMLLTELALYGRN